MRGSLALAIVALLGGCGSDSKLDRVNTPPEVAVLAPAMGELFRQGAGFVALVGEVHDTYDSPADLDCTWTIDGGAAMPVDADGDGLTMLDSLVSDLAIGAHTATIRAIDSDGGEASATVDFEVGGPLGVPTVEITAPEDGSSSTTGDIVAFRGEATDTTTAVADLTFLWSSDLQGELAGAITGDGASSLVLDTLVAGTHLVTLAVTDADAEVGTDAITITVIDPLVIAEPGDLVFSELMINPEVVEDDVGEWVELYNTSGYTIDIAGYTFRDDDQDSWVLEGPILVAGDDYVVLCASMDVAVNGGVPCDGAFFRDPAEGLALANDPDEVILSRPNGEDIDFLHYDEGWINPAVAIGVDPSWQESGANDDLTHWCVQTTVVSTGGEPGTPGQVNDPCGL